MYPNNNTPVQNNVPAENREVRTSDAGGVRREDFNESYYDANGNLVQRQEETYVDDYQMRQNILGRTSAIIYFLVGALEVLLGMRFVFRLLGADQANGLVNFIYNLSSPFVVAFNGIFSDQTLGKGSIFEFSTLLAMVMYAILAWGFVALIHVLFKPNPSSRVSSSTTRRSKY